MSTTASIDENAKPRRWFRFRLRTAFIVLTIVCVWLGWQAKLAREQKAAVAAIRAAGGIVQYSYQFDDNGKEISGAQPPGPAWLRGIIGDDYFVTVEQVTFAMSFTIIGERPKVNALQTGAALKHLSKLPQLKRLYIFDPGLTDADLNTVGTLTQLERLSIHSDLATDSGSRHLAHLSHLKGLTITGGQFSDQTIAELSTLPRLESLELRGGRMTNEGVTYLRRLPSLRGLTLFGRWAGPIPGTEMTGAALKSVADLSQLENLSLQNVDAGDVELEDMARLTKLRSASFSMTRVTEEGMARLQQALPSATLIANTGGGTVYPPATSFAKNTAWGGIGPAVVIPGAAGY